MQIQIDLGPLKSVGSTSEKEVLKVAQKATEDALNDYISDHSLDTAVERTNANSDQPQQDGGATIATVIVTAFLTAAAAELGKIAVQDIVALSKRYLREYYRDKVEVRSDD